MNVTREKGWDMQKHHHRDHWYEGFFGPLTRVGAVAMGLRGDSVDLKSYASDRVVFTELCPYASALFGLAPEQVSHLVESDAAFRTAAQVRQTLLEQAQPALVLVNGRSALEPFEVVHAGRFRWSPRCQYPSADPPSAGKPPRVLWHQNGIYQAAIGPTPVIGFAFLRKPRTHNSNREIDQLGEHARQFRQSVASDGGSGVPDA